jgi:hypothetical protein
MNSIVVPVTLRCRAPTEMQTRQKYIISEKQVRIGRAVGQALQVEWELSFSGPIMSKIQWVVNDQTHKATILTFAFFCVLNDRTKVI